MNSYDPIYDVFTIAPHKTIKIDMSYVITIYDKLTDGLDVIYLN